MGTINDTISFFKSNKFNLISTAGDCKNCKRIYSHEKMKYGNCCCIEGAALMPEDIDGDVAKTINYMYENDLVKSDFWCGFYSGPLLTSKFINGHFGECVMLGPAGCLLASDQRPYSCRYFGYNGSRDYNNKKECETIGCNIWDLIIAWFPYIAYITNIANNGWRGIAVEKNLDAYIEFERKGIEEKLRYRKLEL